MARSKLIKKTAENKVRREHSKPKINIKDSSIMKNIEKNTESELYPGNVVSAGNPECHGLTDSWNIKLVSWNVNGLRASIKKNALSYIREENADIIGLQEVKCSLKDCPVEAKEIKGYKSFFSEAEKNGYAGTAVYSKETPLNITYGIGKEVHDHEGRVITLEYYKFYFITAYVPNSGRGLVRLDYRQTSWDVDFMDYLKGLDKLKPIILCGDLNVSHQEKDLANPKSNSKTAGFTKEERDGFENMLNTVHLVDTFRHIYPQRTGAYTFWSYMGDSRARNIGWRLDYFLISERLLPNLCNHEIRSEVLGSDHCPIVLYLNLD